MPRLAKLFCSLVLLLSFSVSGAHAEKNLERPPGTTRYAAMVQELNALAKYDQTHLRCMTLSSLGKSVQGRDLWMVTVNSPASSISGDKNASHKTVFYLCRQHGHEPASTEGALSFLTSLVKDEKFSPLTDGLTNVTVTVYVVPMANPDGAEAFRRHNAHDIDLNRDWLRRTQPETRALYAALQRLHPDLVTDQHELYPDDARPDFTETAGPGSGAKPEVIADCDDTQAAIQGAMQAEGFSTISHQVTDTHPARLAHRYISVVAGLPTVLFETNRLPGRTVADRAAAQKKFMMIVLRDMVGERPLLLAEGAAWEAAHREMLASRHKMPERPSGKATVVKPIKGTD